MKLSARDIARFWRKIDRSGGANACWPWLAGKTKWGYGKFQTGRHRHQKHHVASRVALALKTGRMHPKTTHARHWKCDNPPCCNPRHLKWGTPKENRRDTVRKGREPRGENKATAKLTNAAVRHIRRVYGRRDPRRRRGKLVEQLAERYRVKRITIYAAAQRRNWKYVA